MPRLNKMIQHDGWTELRRHYSVAHCSDPNYLSLLTGGNPDDHGVHTQMGTKFIKQFPTLQKRLYDVGYATWTYGPLKVPAFYRDGFENLLWHKTADMSPLMAPGPKSAIREVGNKPWFGFMRVMDLHYPYMGQGLGAHQTIRDVNHGYNQAAEHVDRFVSHLVKWVLKRYPNTVVVVGSDHGDHLGEYQMWDHLYSLKDTLVRVPMMVYQPDSGPSKVVTKLTQHTDIAGLILRASGVIDDPPPDRPEGLWLSAWGVGDRKVWKHRAVVVDIEGENVQYTVNWHMEKGASFELYGHGDYIRNYFGHDDLSRQLAGMMVEKYPTFPQPDFDLSREELTAGVGLMKAIIPGDMTESIDGGLDE